MDNSPMTTQEFQNRLKEIGERRTLFPKGAVRPAIDWPVLIRCLGVKGSRILAHEAFGKTGGLFFLKNINSGKYTIIKICDSGDSSGLDSKMLMECSNPKEIVNLWKIIEEQIPWMSRKETLEYLEQIVKEEAGARNFVESAKSILKR